MAVQLMSVCLLAIALLGSLSSAQYFWIPPTLEPQRPQPPQNPQLPVYQKPGSPVGYPQYPNQPKYPQPQRPQDPQRPSPPVILPPQPPRDPQKPSPPLPPWDPQKPGGFLPPGVPLPPQGSQKPGIPYPPQGPQGPQKPGVPLPPPGFPKPVPPQGPGVSLPPQGPPKPGVPLPPQNPPKPGVPLPPQGLPKPLPPQGPGVPLPPQDPQKPGVPLPQYPQTQQPKDPQQPQFPQTPPQEFQSCDVEAQYKIQCGLPGITASECQAISCCFDGQMCYYGKAVTLQCTKDGQFILVVARDATLPNIDLESINFMGNDPKCQTVGTTSAFAIYQFPVTSCGTTMAEEESGIITYENRMSSSYEVAVGPYGAITRDSQFDLMIQCRYIGSTVEALVVEVALLPPPPPIAAPGPLRVELRLGNGQCTMKGCVEEDVAYSSYYLDSDYPVTKVLRDPVYVEVRLLERTDPNLVLTLGRCWATSSPYPQSLPQWDLLIDGCPYRDDRYQTTLVNVGASSGLMYPSHYRRFIFKMFTFVASGPSSPTKKLQEDAILMPLKEKVYIHCNTAVCQPTLQNNCEPRCFRKRRDIAASVKRGSRPETTTVTSQGIIIVDSNHGLQ